MNTQQNNELISQTKPHWVWLAPIRMLIILFIAFGYASTMPRGMDKAEYLSVFGYDPSWYGIAMIFMISGFLALQSLRRHGSPLKFITSRLFRNLPTLAVFAVMVIFIFFPVFGTGEASPKQHIQYFTNVITCFKPDALSPGLLDNALYMCIIQGGIWTFRWGVIAFIGTALLWMMGGLRRNSTLLIMAGSMIIMYATLLIYSVNHSNPILEFTIIGLRLAWAFMVGMCAYAYHAKLPRTLLIPAIGIAIASVQFYFLRWTPFLEISMELALGYLVFLGITSRRRAPQWLRAIPDLSLGLYIFNWPASQLILLTFPAISPLGLIAVSLPIALLCAFLTWIAVSKPINVRLEHTLELQTR